jgi:flagellar hook-associated protein 2
MATIDYVNALGAGAGFDSKAIVEALVEAERAPQQSSLDRLVSRSETRVSAFGIVKSTLELVRDQFRKLNDVSDLNAFSTQSSDSTMLSASASASASAGTYTVAVSQLANRDTYTFDGFNSETDSLNNGETLTVTVTKGGVSTDLTISAPTLTNIVETINDSDLGLTANVIDTGQSSGRYVLSVSSETGSDNAFSISSAVMTGQVQQATAQNASLTVNGVSITSSSNTVGSALAGVTLDLKGTFAAETITVTRDTSGVKAEIETLVEVYNEAQAIFNSLRNGSDPDDELVGSLATDTIFRSIQSSFRNTFSSISSTPSGDISYWADLGVSVQRDGTLAVDEDRLDSALASSFDDVMTALTADTESQSDIGIADRGLAGDMSAMIRDLTKANGSISNAINSANTSLSDYEERLVQLDARMERIKERYTQQFAAMQQIVDGFNATGEYLKNNLAALNSND